MQVKSTIKRVLSKAKTAYLNRRQQHIDSRQWKTLSETISFAGSFREISLGNHGGQCFIGDINGDGNFEFLWLQTAGMFKARLYQSMPGLKSLLNQENQELFCLTATTSNGSILWQIGNPWTSRPSHRTMPDLPYVSHAAEQMVKTADIDGDGHMEILVLDSSSRLLVLEGATGRIKSSVQLPGDNFANVFCSVGTDPSRSRIIVGVTDRGYAPHEYGNPWIVFDGNLRLLKQRTVKGGGHTAIVEDIDGDGDEEFLIGYDLIDRDGNTKWTVSSVAEREIDPLEEHVDHCESVWIGGEWFGAIAGSDRQYLFDANGKVHWEHSLPHPQYCLFGKFKGQHRVFVYNQRSSMNSFSLDGKELFRGLLPECWPYGRPACAIRERPIHTARPASLVRTADTDDDLMVYAEGGWPYLVDFDGRMRLLLPAGKNIQKVDPGTRLHRINDIGMSYEVDTIRSPNGVADQVLVYDRNWAWIFEVGDGASLNQ